MKSSPLRKGLEKGDTCRLSLPWVRSVEDASAARRAKKLGVDPSDSKIRLHPRKCIIYSVEKCGGAQLNSKGRIWFDPTMLNGLIELNLPNTGAHLQQFICAMKWVTCSIPNFPNQITPRQDFMEPVYDVAGNKKSAMSRSAIWDGPRETGLFWKVQKST